MRNGNSIPSIEVQPEYRSETGMMSITDAYFLVMKLIDQSRQISNGERLREDLLKVKAILSQFVNPIFLE